MPLGEFAIGRSSSCNLALADGLVSRRHAVLHVGPETVVVEDLGSRNGVAVNGVRINGPRRLAHMDRVYIGSQELVLIDAGVELHSYASDVTRTYPVGGRFEGATRDVYQAVLEAQEAAFAAITPGATLESIHRAALGKLVDGMIDLGALSGTRDELLETEAYKPFYMHTTGHFLGLDVHDVGKYHVEGKPRPLEPRMCFTVEPGLYFSTAVEETPEHLRGIGVRIEDDVVMTEDGFENLTASIPKTVEDVESWTRG